MLENGVATAKLAPIQAQDLERRQRRCQAKANFPYRVLWHGAAQAQEQAQVIPSLVRWMVPVVRMRPSSRTALSVLVASAIAAFFLRFTAPSLQVYFSPDDCMNLYRSWANPLNALAKANLLFFLNSPFYRPFVSVWYRCVYYFAGFNPIPFHVSILIILLANIWLTYAVCRRLTASRETGALAALLISYHPKFGQLYFDTGYAYDVICYFFFFSAFLLYLRVRQQDRGFRIWEWIAFFVLYICALNSKEIAVMLPVLLAIYELLYGSVPLRSVRELFRWVGRQGALLIVSGLVTLAFVLGRTLDHDNALLAIGPYKPVFTWARFMETSRNFLNNLFIARHPIVSDGLLLGLWLAMLVIGWASRSRPLRFAWLFLMLSSIPIAFILPRGAAQYYVPLFGWVLYTATVLVSGTEYLARLATRIPIRPLLAVRAPALFVAVGLILLHYYRRPWVNDLPWHSLEPDLHRSIVEQLHQLRPQLRHGSRILFLEDPYPTDDGFRMMYLVTLSYQDPTLTVDRVKRMPHLASGKDIASYDYLFDYRFGRFFTSAQPRPQGPEPVLTFEWGQPAVFHYADFKRVTRQHPAHTGEVVIAQAKDLGETKPAVPPGQPFPQDPLLNVISPVSVRVGGQPVDVIRKMGWPELVNTFRIDFCIPNNARPGEIEIEITASGIKGPGVMIPVR